MDTVSNGDTPGVMTGQVVPSMQPRVALAHDSCDQLS